MSCASLFAALQLVCNISYTEQIYRVHSASLIDLPGFDIKIWCQNASFLNIRNAALNQVLCRHRELAERVPGHSVMSI